MQPIRRRRTTSHGNKRACPSLAGLPSTQDLEEALWAMLSPGELSREHLRAVIEGMDPQRTGKVGLREVVTFVRARQGRVAGRDAARRAEAGLLR